MCQPAQQLTPAAAMAAVTTGLGVLAGLDMTTLTAGEHAELLRALGLGRAGRRTQGTRPRRVHGPAQPRGDHGDRQAPVRY